MFRRQRPLRRLSRLCKRTALAKRPKNEKGTAAALPYHKRAIQVDPNFAMGYRAVGADNNGQSALGRASEYHTKAFQLQEDASERERLSIAADYYLNVTGELDKAVQTYQKRIESYPRDSAAYHNLGIVYGAQGQYEKAAEVARQAVRLAPGRVGTYEGLANYTLDEVAECRAFYGQEALTLLSMSSCPSRR